MNEKKLEIKFPATREEYEALLDSLNEVSEDDLDNIVGGNDDLKTKFNETMVVTCTQCGQSVKCKMMQDMAKHMTKCPNNPYK